MTRFTTIILDDEDLLKMLYDLGNLPCDKFDPNNYKITKVDGGFVINILQSEGNTFTLEDFTTKWRTLISD